MDFLRNKGAKFLQFIAIWAKRNFHALIFKVATVARLCLLTHHSKSPFTYLSKTKVTISIQNYKMPLARFARIFNFVLQFILGVRWKLEPRKRLDRKTKMMTDLVPQKKRDEQTVGNQHFFQWFNKTSPYISASQSRPAVYLLLLLCQAHERKEFYEKMGRAVNRIWSTVT